MGMEREEEAVFDLDVVRREVEEEEKNVMLQVREQGINSSPMSTMETLLLLD